MNLIGEWSLHQIDSSTSRPPLSNDSKVMLLWSDPPYGTGKIQQQGGVRYKDSSETQYVLDAIAKWIPFMHENGTIAICCDYRLASKVVTFIEVSHGWCFRGEIVWEFGLGRPRTSWWANRHNTILTFTRSESSGKFNQDAVPTTKRLAPKDGYQGDKKIGSVWNYTMSNTSSERVGYPNQKPISIIEPFVLAHTDRGDLVADPFCGSSSTGVASIRNGRNFVGCDIGEEAIKISTQRLSAPILSKSITTPNRRKKDGAVQRLA